MLGLRKARAANWEAVAYNATTGARSANGSSYIDDTGGYRCGCHIGMWIGRLRLRPRFHQDQNGLAAAGCHRMLEQHWLKQCYICKTRKAIVDEYFFIIVCAHEGALSWLGNLLTLLIMPKKLGKPKTHNLVIGIIEQWKYCSMLEFLKNEVCK